MLRVLDAKRLAERFPGIQLKDVLRKPYFVGFSIEVSDLGATQALLETNGVALRRVGERLQIASEQGFGAVIEFVVET